jgi:LysM repeat protein
MIKNSQIVLLIILTVAAASCRSAKVATTVPVKQQVKDYNCQSYIDRYAALAVSEMKRTGIPASITLAQGMIESDFGRSSLASEGNNHFGIKCHDNWTGQVIRHDDERRNECFRKYPRPEDSFYDHSDFLKSVPRYRELFNLSPTDYKGWARGLKRTGYATNPDYANMLIRKIEEYNLDYFDRGGKLPERQEIATLPEKSVQKDSSNPAPSVKPLNTGSVVSVPEHVSRVQENNRIQYIIVREGESLSSIENEFQLLKWELTRYNEIDGSFVPVPGQILYLQPKRDKAEPGKDMHVVHEGDSMYSISQIYGVRMKKLYEYNRMSENSQPAVGDKIWLRAMKPVN